MKKQTLIFLAIFIARSLFALDVPPLKARINDTAHLMNATDKQEAENYLADLEEKTGIQVAVLTINSLEGEILESYSLKVAEQWGLGQKEKDNGILLLVSLKERKVRIEVGYGLEGDLTDVKSGLIIRNIIIPKFQNSDYSKGILLAVKNIAGIVGKDAELISKSVSNPKKSSGGESVLFGFLFIFAWFILFSCIASGRENHFLPWIIFTPTYRKKHPYTGNSHTSYSSFNSFGSSFSSGSRGFSGGGGHFGGGGASGSW